MALPSSLMSPEPAPDNRDNASTSPNKPNSPKPGETSTKTSPGKPIKSPRRKMVEGGKPPTPPPAPPPQMLLANRIAHYDELVLSSPSSSMRCMLRFAMLWTRFNPFSCTMDGMKRFASYRGRAVAFVDSCLRGLGQVVFLDNPVMGLFVVAAAFVNNVHLATMGLLGVMSSTLIGIFLGVDHGIVRGGILGYNGYLTGTAVALFQPGWGHDEWNFPLFMPVVFVAAMSTIVTLALAHVFSRIADKPVAPFTLPFHIVTWVWLLGAQNYVRFPNSLDAPALEVPTTIADRSGSVTFDWDMLPESIIVGLGQVFFFDRLASGIIVLIGMTVCSPVAAVMATFGSTLGCLTAICLGAPAAQVTKGLWGYNPALSTEAIGGVFFELGSTSGFLAGLAGVATTLVHGAVVAALAPVGMPAITFPAAITSVLFALAGGSMPSVEVIPLQHVTTPEQHILRERDMFDGAWKFIDDLHYQDDMTHHGWRGYGEDLTVHSGITVTSVFAVHPV
eukprot:m.108037 g.108037  ORF g.108037 m.108037 type:complete len:505 (+) comp15878_c0_seq2:240-1754(+)